MHEVHYSLQDKIVGKPTLDESEILRRQGAYDRGWHGHFTSVGELAEHVAEKGYAWSTSIFRKAERLSSKFVQADMFALDFDNKDKNGKLPDDEMVKPDDLFINNPLAEGICLIYLSSSSTPEWPRFRVVYKVATAYRDRKSYKAFTHRIHAVHNNLYKGLDGCMDEARIWYGSTQGIHYLNEQALVNLDTLEYQWDSLPDTDRQFYEFKALKDVVPREVLISKGLIKAKDQYVGDVETEGKIFELCLSFIPKWESEGWYEEGSWIFGAAVHTLGVELAAEVLEKVWGEYPRAHKRDLFTELLQWESDSGGGLNAGLGSVIYKAQQSEDWTDTESTKLKALQAEGIDRSSFNSKFNDELSLEAVQELFSVYKVSTVESLKPTVGKMTFTEKLQAVESGIQEIIQDSTKSRHYPKARNLNDMLGSPLDNTEIKREIQKGYLALREKNNAGEKPLVGWNAIKQAAEQVEANAGYLVENVIPKGSCTLAAGPPKVGKTSNLLTLLINSFITSKAGKGINGESFKHLTIYSDDQKAGFTAEMLVKARRGIEDVDPDELERKDFNVYPSLKLDDDGIERLKQKAEATPGGCFVIDSLMSTAGKLGFNENDSQISNVIYDLREAIETVDPTATIVIIHHQTKNGTNGKSQVDSMRGSSAIPGAVDNILSIEKPSVKKNGNDVADDMTPDRVFHLSGRNVKESKVVFRGITKTEIVASVDPEFDAKELDSFKIEFLCNHSEYTSNRPGSETISTFQEKINALPKQQREVYDMIAKNPNGIQQGHLKDWSKSAVSKAVNHLKASPTLIRVEKDDQWTILYPEDLEDF